MNLWNLTTRNIDLDKGLYCIETEVTAMETDQRKSAYVSRKPVWRTLLELSSIIGYEKLRKFLILRSFEARCQDGETYIVASCYNDLN